MLHQCGACDGSGRCQHRFHDASCPLEALNVAIKVRVCSVGNTDVAEVPPPESELFPPHLGPGIIWAYNATMPRSLVWIERPGFAGFGCSECQWVFHFAGPLLAHRLTK